MQFSIAFNPLTDDIQDVLESVEHMFNIADIMGATAAPAAQAEARTAAAPLASAAPAVAGTPQLDSTGLPWDGRIHSDPASLTTKGVWRTRRGADKQVIAQVEAELRARVGGQAQAPAAPAQAPVAPPAPPAPAPLAPLAPVAPPAPPAAPSAYEQLVKYISDNLYSEANPTGRMSNEWVQQSLLALGVPGGMVQNSHNMGDAAINGIIGALRQAMGE